MNVDPGFDTHRMLCVTSALMRTHDELGEVIRVRITQRLREQIQAIARSQQLSVSDTLRKALHEYLVKQTTKAGQASFR
jgi:hypothetical protein